jgi:glycine/D-amino acid oxidase-like deaminating enzyme
VLRRTGSLRLADSAEEKADCEAQRAAMAADGLPVEPYEGPDGAGLLFPADAAGNPLARCRALAQLALDAGATLHGASPAVGIGPNQVVTPQGTVACGRVVVAVDGGLEVLLPELAGRVRYGFDYWQQLPDGRVAAGGLRDRFADAEWGQPDEPSADVQRALEVMLRERIGVRAPVTHRWAGAVAFTDSHMPIAEEVRPGVLAIGAYSGTGNVLGALYGRAAADWCDTGQLLLPR